jgi:hypothetical protein
VDDKRPFLPHAEQDIEVGVPLTTAVALGRNEKSIEVDDG